MLLALSMVLNSSMVLNTVRLNRSMVLNTVRLNSGAVLSTVRLNSGVVLNTIQLSAVRLNSRVVLNTMLLFILVVPTGLSASVTVIKMTTPDLAQARGSNNTWAQTCAKSRLPGCKTSKSSSKNVTHSSCNCRCSNNASIITERSPNRNSQTIWPWTN